MKTLGRPISVAAMTRKVDVDSRIPLHHYYGIADHLLKQASIYREEKNIVELYVMLLRYSSLVCETIALHRDFQGSGSKERAIHKKKLLGALDELETLKPEVHRQVNEMNKVHDGDQLHQLDGTERTAYSWRISSLEGPAINMGTSLIQQPTSTAPQSSWTSNTWQVDKQFQKL